MTDREKLEDLLHDYFGHDSMYSNIEAIDLADFLVTNGVTVREMKKPLHRGQLADNGFFFLERKEEEEVYPVVLKEGWELYFVDFVGTDSFVRHDKADYGKNWRCWAEKPTEEERQAAEWE